MEMTRTQQIKMGAFVVVGLFLICASILVFGGNKSLFKSYVRLKAHFPQVQGVAKGSIVSLAGVVVGNVEDIDFANTDENNLEVILKIEKRYLSRIRAGTLAEVRTQGALGDKYVYLIPGPTDKPSVSENDLIPLAPATDLLSTLSERGHEAERIFEILKEVQILTHTLNSSGRIEKILGNLSNTTTSLNNKIQDLDLKSISDKSNAVLNKVDNIVSKIDKGQGTLGSLINDPYIHDRVKSMLGGGSSPRKDYLRSVIKSSTEK
ncbi:MAG: MlaD family protein [Pseudobdellovibrionaceae bacterium]